MKLKKVLFLLPILAFSLVGCNTITNVTPTSLKASSNEVKLIINSERDLNDIVTLRFEPKNTSNKEVTWSSNENDIFLLNGSTIKAKKIGSAVVTATSVENTNLYTDITVKVYDPNAKTYSVSINEGNGFNVTGLQSEYEEGSEVVFAVNVTDSTKEVEEVKANNDVLESNNETYIFTMPSEDVIINVTLKDKELNNVTGESIITLGEHSNVIVKVDEIEFNNDITIKNGETFTFKVEPNNGFSVDKVLVNDKEIVETNGYYSFVVSCNATIKIIASNSSITSQALAKYNIKYDLGTRKTAKQITTEEELLSSFELDGDEGLITAISQMEYIYGGGNGGRSETAWYTGDMLKFGTTSVNGSMTLTLNKEVNRIKITGYVSDSASKIQVGDSTSTDWTEETNDNKTTLFTCSNMNEATKDVVEGKQTSTIIIDFANTKDLKIATTNKKPLYITSIEFIVYTNEAM